MMLIFVVSLIAYFSLHSIMTEDQVKRFIVSHSPIKKETYRLFYNIVAIVTLLPVVYLFFALKVEIIYPVPSAVSWILKGSGILMVAFGLILQNLAMTSYNLRQFAGIDQLNPKKDAKPLLVTHGILGRVRHPLYSGTLFIFWGLLLIFPWQKLLISNLIITLYIYLGTLSEERKLRQQFGQDYEDHMKKVPRFIPRW